MWRHGWTFGIFTAGISLVLGAVTVVARDDSVRTAQKSGDIFTNSIGMKLVSIPAGEFVMGSSGDESGREEDEARHTVRITRPFHISVTEITQAQWTAVMGQRKGAFQGEDRPVESVSWKDAVAFCEKLSKAEGRKYRLPTEAEWEYACRAGAPGKFSGMEKLAELGWFDENSDETTHSVAAKKPNAWGLYDMHGNVAEWCADYYAPKHPRESVNDPTGPADGKNRVVRGGSFASTARGCRCAARANTPEGYQLKFVGFRVVLDSAPRKPWDLYVMDTWFWASPEITVSEQIALLKRLGVSGLACSWGHKQAEQLKALKDAGLRCSGIYTVVSIDDPNGPPWLGDLIEQLKGTDALVWLALTSDKYAKSDPAGDDAAIALVTKLANDLKAAGLPGIAFYPHINHWLERVGDGVRLVKRLNRPDVGVQFNQYHWMAVEGGQDLRGTLANALPHLRGVSINGSAAAAPSILSLGEGDYDTFQIFKTLADLGYTGPIATQGYSIKGRIPERLEETRRAWEAYLNRLKP